MKIVARTLIRWSWLLLLCLVIGWFAGKPVAALLPPTYQAITTIELNTSSHGAGIVKPVTTYASLLTSDSVLGTVLKKHPNIDPLTFTSKGLVVVPALASETLQVEVTLPNAKEAADVANDLSQTLVTQQNALIKSQIAQEIKLLTTRIATEQTTINNLNQQILKTPTTDTSTIQLYQSQITQQQQLQTRDITTLQSMQEEQQLNSSPLSIVEVAQPPKKPSSILGLIPFSPVLAFLLFAGGLATVIFIEQRAGRINSASALQQKAKLPVLGALRWTSALPNRLPPYKLSTSNDPYAEECKVMMADILFHAEKAGAHVLAIAAARPQAGTSIIAAELSTLLAQSNRSVLLIDANLHQPVQHKLLDVSNGAGLARLLEDVTALKAHALPGTDHMPTELPQQVASTYDAGWGGDHLPTIPLPTMTAQAKKDADTQNSSHKRRFDFMDRLTLDNYILPTKIQNMYLLPAGKPATAVDPSSLLNIPEMEVLLQQFTKRVDFVVIDCPSLYHAEAHVLGSLSDQTYLVVDVTKNRMKQVLSTKEDMLSTNVKLTSLIANKLGRWI